MSVCFDILAHVTWALAREWALFIPAAKTVTCTWVLARDTTMYLDARRQYHVSGVHSNLNQPTRLIELGAVLVFSIIAPINNTKLFMLFSHIFIW